MKLFQSKLSVALAILFVVLVLVIGFYIWTVVSSGGINIEASAEGEKIIGEPFDLKVNLSNNSKNILNESKIILELPDGITPVNGEVSQRIIEREVGSIDVNKVHQEIFKVMATPSRESMREFTITLSYTPGTIAAHFEKTRKFGVDIQPLQTDLSLKAPEKVFSGEEFEITANYEARNPETSPKLFLKASYPDNFVKISEDLVESSSTSGKLSAKGKVNFPDDASFDIKVQIFTSLLGRDYLVSEETARVLISPSPLSFKLIVNGKDNLVAYANDTLDYTLIYKNNTQVGLQDVVIRSKLMGDMFDFRTLDSKEAKFNLFNRTITWDSNTFKDLVLLNAGEERSVNFSIKLRETYPIKKLNDKNFILKVEANIDSPTVPYLVSADKTVNYVTLETKVGGKVEVDARGFFRDAVTGILNKGPWPPKVGQSTQYTVHWFLTNFSSDVRDIEVRAAVEDGVVFTGIIRSNTTPPPEINQESGEIIWKIDRLVATTGITGEKPEAIFQIEANPTLDKKGNYMPLLSVTQVKAFDEFGETEIFNSDEAITTQLSHDSTVVEGQGKVIE